jgi:two-component system sensor histidine kinase ChvG
MKLLRWFKAQLLRIRSRLLLINTIAVLVPIVGLLWARAYEREALWALERDMRHQAELLRTVAEHNLDPSGEPRLELLAPALRTAATRTRTRVRLLDPSGNLVADSHRRGPPEGPEPPIPRVLGATYKPERRHPGSTDPGPLDDRREIRAALRGELGTATRIHERIQRVYLFVALPIMVHKRVRGIVYVTRSTVPVLYSLYRLRRNLMWVLIVALSATALLSVFLATTISAPLARLTRAARRIAAGDRSLRAQIERSDEIGQLAQAFDAMVEQLDARTRYISQFAANISHEFKTPLTSIRGAAELVLDSAAEDRPARERFLRNILGDVDRLDRLVSRLLELSRIEASLEKREQLDLAHLVTRVVGELRERSNASIVVSGTECELPFIGNGPHLRSVLVALMENAIRHNAPEKPIAVALEATAEHVTLRVRDEGSGISPANQAKIFDRFFTTEAERGGTGLGLAIVKAVVQAHGGQVTVQSSPGAGSTFTVVLPKRLEVAAPEA